MVMGLISGLSLAGHSDSESFLVVCTSLSQEKDSGRLVGLMGWHLLSPFEVSQILLVGGSFLVPCSLSGPPVVKITHASGYYLAWPGWVVSVSVSPNKFVCIVFFRFHIQMISYDICPV